MQLELDDDRISGRWTPSAALRTADGSVAPIAITTLLDEAAFWLGATPRVAELCASAMEVQRLTSASATERDVAAAPVGRAAMPMPAFDSMLWQFYAGRTSLLQR